MRALQKLNQNEAVRLSDYGILIEKVSALSVEWSDTIHKHDKDTLYLFTTCPAIRELIMYKNLLCMYSIQVYKNMRTKTLKFKLDILIFSNT